jgi:LacI family transcriptional regulator
MKAKSVLRDVAQAADVSVRTASRVLNNDARVAAGTRQRVQEAIRQLGFQPDPLARSLRAGTDATIGVVVESVADPFFAALVEAVESAVAEDGRSVLVASTHRDGVAERRLLDRMLQRRVSGLLIAPTGDDHSWLAETSAAVIFVDRSATGLDADLVGIDDRGAARAAVRHLIDHGHRRIAYIGDSPTISTSAARVQGYRDALTDARLDISGNLIRVDGQTSALAGAAAAALLGLDEPPTAIFSATTRCSLGVVPALHACRRTDVALVGFGDFAMADTLQPAISVIDHSGEKLGLAAVNRLRARLADPALPVEQIRLPVRLVQRGSGEQRP